ncbi:GntR family transcriptional regulator [Paenibacillus spongiae]|uniref:GntR family transcriptional regulator n=1 Tax=Paenibacillus spongiae TaxID=2909671 RepID=A0ABY5SE59_9BACL|nr:GntR family transcriptional regulator [Paenibacillus spongiae]UVI31808.1 GntR family transcriptional regulator [Paenibacillus spongiae]
MSQPITNQPLYLQIRGMLKEKIEQGELQPGDQIPTEADLIQQFGVSRITIKSALKLLVDEGLVYRIAGKGTFVADPYAAPEAAPAPTEEPELALRKIGFLSPMANDQFSMQLLQGVEEACKEQNVILIVRWSSTQAEEKEGIRFLRAAGVEGLLIFPVDGESYSEAILSLKTEGFPFVLIDRYLPGIKTNAVYSDNYLGGYIGTEYLISKGHRQIGIVSGTKSKTSSSEDRFSGYLVMAKKAGLRIEPSHWLTRIDEITYMDTDVSQEMVHDWLLSQPEITAVFAFSSAIAVHVGEVAIKLGKKVPEELAILSFDTPPIRDFNGNFFSCIQQQEGKMGEEAVTLLRETIEDPTIIREIIIPVSLREERTT